MASTGPPRRHGWRSPVAAGRRPDGQGRLIAPAGESTRGAGRSKRSRRRRRGNVRLGARAGVLVIALVLLLLAGWAAGEATHAAFHAFDRAAVEDLVTQRSELLTWIAKALSLSGSILVIAPLAGVCCAALYRAGRVWASMLLAISSGGAALIFNVDKLIVARPRPSVEHLVLAPHSSFPSGHATLSAAFYGALLIVLVVQARRGMPRVAAVTAVALLVLGIALSRVYLGVHYPTDVGAGVALGAAWTLTVALSLRGGPARAPRAVCADLTAASTKSREPPAPPDPRSAISATTRPLIRR